MCFTLTITNYVLIYFIASVVVLESVYFRFILQFSLFHRVMILILLLKVSREREFLIDCYQNLNEEFLRLCIIRGLFI